MGPLTASADIYSLAKTCYTMLCGRVPFEFNGKPIASLPSPADSETWAQELLKILKRATAAEVGHRYGSVAEFWSELAALATFDPAATKALPFKRPTPEDSELAKKRAELSPLAAILAQRELELATLQAELRDFESRYLRIVGVRYTELDEIEAQIAEAIAKLNLKDEDARAKADRARSQANESATATEAAKEEEGGEHKFEASETLKKLRWEAARLIHPDTVLDEREKQRHHEWWVKVNQAFYDRDEEGLREIINQWQSSPESVKGEGVEADWRRVVRKIALVDQRLKTIEKEIQSLEASDLYTLKSKAEKAENEGRDLLEEMATPVKERIDKARDRLEEILRTRLAT